LPQNRRREIGDEFILLFGSLFQHRSRAWHLIQDLRQNSFHNRL
jgi:hypothetical protein